jgi:predicted small metal-binding protein
MKEEEKVVRKAIHCPCGFVVRADDEAVLVSRAQQHARDVHHVDLPREQALAMARPE